MMTCPHCGAGHAGVGSDAHDKRVTELLQHNNELLERARAADRRADDSMKAVLASAQVGVILMNEILRLESLLNGGNK